MSASGPDRRLQIALIALFAATLVAVAIVISETDEGADDERSPAETQALFAGIPQSGFVLGEPDAEARLIEFADLQCPFCAQFSEEVLPVIVDEYVRDGRLAIDFQPLTFIGSDSEAAARAAVAASEQDLMWDFVSAFYAEQGAENSGYADEGFLREIASSVDGLDADQVLASADSKAVSRSLADAKDLAEELGIDSTPSFALAHGNAPPELLEFSSLEPAAFSAELDAALGGP